MYIPLWTEQEFSTLGRNVLSTLGRNIYKSPIFLHVGPKASNFHVRLNRIFYAENTFGPNIDNSCSAYIWNNTSQPNVESAF